MKNKQTKNLYTQIILKMLKCHLMLCFENYGMFHFPWIYTGEQKAQGTTKSILSIFCSKSFYFKTW